MTDDCAAARRRFAQATESQTALDLLASIAAQQGSASAHEPDDKRAGAKDKVVSDTLP
jgi:hypothetical protein